MNNTPVTGTRRRGRLGSFRLAQVIGIEVALSALLFVPGLDWMWRGGIAAAIVLIGLGHTRGRPWLIWLSDWFRYRSRRRIDKKFDGDVTQAGPQPQIASIAERGTNVGIAFDGTGWFAAVRLDSQEPPQSAFDALTKVLTGPGVPVSSMQLVTQTVPGEGAGWFARRDSWFVVRLDVRGSHSIASDRGGGEVGIHRALSGVVSRLMKGSRVHGVRMRPLGADELASALQYSLDGGNSPGEPATEGWKAWHAGDGAGDQATFWLQGALPSVDDARRLWTEVSGLAAKFCTVSLALRKASDRPAEHRLALRCQVRLAAEPDKLAKLGRDLTDLARSHHIKLRRSDGTHGPAAYASAISGGMW